MSKPLRVAAREADAKHDRGHLFGRDPSDVATIRHGASSPGHEDGQDSLGAKVWVLGALMVLLGVAMAILMLREFRSQSYLYLTFYSIPSNAAISVFPHEPVLIYFGKFANIWFAALAATIGTIVAGYLDYSVFVPVLNHQRLQSYKQKKLYRKTISLFGRLPFVTIMMAGFTPVPFFLFKFLTFSVKYPLWRYQLAVVLGRFPRYVLLGWLGAEFAIPNWVLFGAFLFVIGLYTIKGLPQLVAHLRRLGTAERTE